MVRHEGTNLVVFPSAGKLATLVRFGPLDDLAATPPRQEYLRQLSDLVALRRKLLDQLGTLRKLCAELDPPTAQRSTATLNALRLGITAAVLFRRAAIIGSVPGCGGLTAVRLCADMPALGTLGPAGTIATLDSTWAGAPSAAGAPILGESLTWRRSRRSAGSPIATPATSA